MTHSENAPAFSPLCLDRTVCEYLRAIAIVAVIAGHLLGGRFGLISDQLTVLFGVGGVTVFLLLSGYGLFCSFNAEGISPRVYWEKKINKVFVPYGIITAVFFLCQRLGGADINFGVLLENILCVDFQRQLDGTMWYMSFLLLWYVLFFFVFSVRVATPIRIVFLFMWSFALRDNWLYAFFGDCASQFYTHAFAFPLGVSMGYLMDLVNRHYNGCPMPLWLRGGRWLMLGCCVLIFIISPLTLNSTLFFIYGCALFVLLYQLLRWIKRPLPILGWIGANSFLLYLLEGKLLGIVDRWQIVSHSPVLLCLLYTAVLLASVFLYLYASRLCTALLRWAEASPRT